MIYFKDMDYVSGGYHVTSNKAEAAHFHYEDQSSISAIDVIVALINLVSANEWKAIVDKDDEDARHIIVRKK